MTHRFTGFTGSAKLLYFMTSHCHFLNCCLAGGGEAIHSLMHSLKWDPSDGFVE